MDNRKMTKINCLAAGANVSFLVLIHFISRIFSQPRHPEEACTTGSLLRVGELPKFELVALLLRMMSPLGVVVPQNKTSKPNRAAILVVVNVLEKSLGVPW